MADHFTAYRDNVSSPARRAEAVAPTDADVEISPLPKALLIGAAGTITFRAIDSAADVTVPVSAGQVLPVRVRYVRFTGTSAASILALS